MSNEELVERIQKGEQKLMAMLWEQVRRFVAKRANFFSFQYDGTSKVDRDDLIQSGYFALVEAIKTYKPDAGCSFIGYLDYYLRNQFRKEVGIRSSHRDALTKAISLDDSVFDEDDGDTTLLSMIRSDSAEAEFDEVVEQLDNARIVDTVRKCMQKLKPSERDVLLQIYIQQRKRKEIANLYGVSPQRVNQIHNRALRRLRTMPAVRKIKMDNYLDLYTRFYKCKSYKAFNTSFSSVVEDLVLSRERVQLGLKTPIGVMPLI